MRSHLSTDSTQFRCFYCPPDYDHLHPEAAVVSRHGDMTRLTQIRQTYIAAMIDSTDHLLIIQLRGNFRAI